MDFWIFFFLYKIATSYNVDELPVSIITRPASTDRSDVQMEQETSLFGYSLAARVIQGERRILIGAPTQGTTGALYNCDEYSSHCQSYYSDALYQNSSMFGSSVKWINDDLLISCEPRFTEYSKCYRMEGKKNIQCKRSENDPGTLLTHDEATIPGRCHLIDPNKRDGRVQYAHGCIQTEDFIDENDLTNTCNSQLGISITLLDSKSAFLSRPGFKYSEGGFSVANIDLEESWQHPALIETSSQLDNYYIRNSHLLPDHIREFCKIKGVQYREFKSYNIECITKYMTQEYDHTHLGMTSALYEDGILVGAPHKYRSELTGSLSFYKIIRNRDHNYASISEIEDWNISSKSFDQELEIRTGDLFGWSLSVGDFDGDGNQDILIGSPGYSKRRLPNLGRAVILFGSHESSRRGTFSKIEILENPSKDTQSFGYLVNVLDINKDGCGDAVVSAPFGEFGGEVSIYNGAGDGIQRTQPSQRIRRSHPTKQLVPDWFGFSTELLDEKFLIIGAPKNESVEVYKLKPSVKIEISTKRLPKVPIVFEAREIKYQICARYTATANSLSDLPRRLEFQMNAYHDIEHGRASVAHQSSMFELNMGKELCNEFRVEIKDKFYFNKIKDFVIDINATLTDLEAALDPYSNVAIRRKIRFDKKCGSDDKCDSILKIEGNASKERITYGPESKVDLRIKITNDGENSYGTYLYIQNEDFKNYKLESAFAYIGKDSKRPNKLTCEEVEDQAGIRKCLVANPMDHQDRHVTLRYRIFPSISVDRTTFRLFANNSNYETQESNEIEISIFHDVDIRPRTSVILEPNFLTYEANPDFGLFQWHYEVLNAGASSLNGKININFPRFTIGGRKIFEEITQSNIDATKVARNGETQHFNCSIPNLWSEDFTPYRIHDFEYRMVNNFRYYGCSKDTCKGPCAAKCITITCDLSERSFEKYDKIKIDLKAQLNHGVFNMPLVNLYNNSKFIPEFEFEIVDLPFSWMDVNRDLETTKWLSSSYLTIVLPVQQLGNIPILWIILAVLFGILLIALISIIMYRTGCFTRSPVGDEDVDIPYHAAEIHHTRSAHSQPLTTTTLNASYNPGDKRTVY